MKLALTFSNIYESDTEKVGLRAVSLAKLFQSKNKVPPSFVIPNFVFEEFLVQSRLIVELKNVFGNISMDDSEVLQRAYVKAKALFSRAKMPEEFLEHLSEAYKSLGVRTNVSAADSFLEDEEPAVNLAVSPDYALNPDLFQGVLLNVRGFDQFVDAVKSCWLSLFSPSFIRWRATNGINDFRAGVIVQRRISPEASAESVYAKADSNILVKAYKGLPDITRSSSKDAFFVSKDDLKIVSSNRLHQEFRVVPGEKSGVLVKKYLKGLGSEQKISDRLVEEIARLSKRAHSLVGSSLKAYFLIRADGIYFFMVDAFEEKSSAKKSVVVPIPEGVDEEDVSDSSPDPDIDEDDSSKEYDELADDSDSRYPAAQAQVVEDDVSEESVEELAGSGGGEELVPDASSSQFVESDSEEDEFIISGPESTEEDEQPPFQDGQGGDVDFFNSLVDELEPLLDKAVLEKYEDFFQVKPESVEEAIVELAGNQEIPEKDDLLLFKKLSREGSESAGVDVDTLFRLADSIKKFVGVRDEE